MPTMQPSMPRRRQIARPMPLAPPVTMAVFPVRPRISAFLLHGQRQSFARLDGAAIRFRLGQRIGLDKTRMAALDETLVVPRAARLPGDLLVGHGAEDLCREDRKSTRLNSSH